MKIRNKILLAMIAIGIIPVGVTLTVVGNVTTIDKDIWGLVIVITSYSIHYTKLYEALRILQYCGKGRDPGRTDRLRPEDGGTATSGAYQRTGPGDAVAAGVRGTSPEGAGFRLARPPRKLSIRTAGRAG